MRLFTLRGPVLRVPWPLVILAWLAQLVRGILAGMLAHPWATGLGLGLLGLGLTARAWGWPVVGGAVTAVCLALYGWAEIGPGSFETLIGRPWRSRLRRVWVYQREWQPAMTLGKLAPGDYMPRLVKVTSSPGNDVVLVDPVAGQTLEDWRAAAPRLAAAFTARVVRVRRSPRAGLLELHVAVKGAPAPEQPVPDEPTAPRGAFPRAPR